MEGRSNDRSQLIYLLKVGDAEKGTFIGQVADITTTGIMLVCPEYVDPDQEYALSIELPQEMKTESHIVVKSVCKWCRPDSDPRFYSCGFEFVNLLPDNAVLIQTLIDDFFYEDSDEDEIFPETEPEQ